MMKSALIPLVFVCVAGDHGYGYLEASSLSSRRAVLLHSLDTVDALVDVCGDFLSSKVSEDLWPLVKVRTCLPRGIPCRRWKCGGL